MKDYDGAQERIEKAVESLLKNSKPLFDLRKTRSFCDFYCRNCGRSVYVGKCCTSPDIQEMERPAVSEILRCPTPEEIKGVDDETEDLSNIIDQAVKSIREEMDKEIVQDIVDSLKQASPNDTGGTPRGTMEIITSANNRNIHASQMVARQLKEGSKVATFFMEPEIDFDRIREGKNAMLREFNRRRVIAEKEGTIRCIPITKLSPEVFDRIEELSKEPADPSPALIDLIASKRKFKRQ